METESLARLLSGTSGRPPWLCRAALSVLMGLRLGSLALGAKTLWRDEVADLLCNSSAQNCLLACFDASFPISPFNLFLLHMASLVAHSLACAFLFHAPKYQGKRKGQLRGQSPELWLDGISLLAKLLLEAIFLMVFHSLYSQYPTRLLCPPSASCPQNTICIVQNASWKDAFSLFFVGASWVSVALCLITLYQTVIKMLQRTLGPGESQLDHPGWPNGHYIESELEETPRVIKSAMQEDTIIALLTDVSKPLKETPPSSYRLAFGWKMANDKVQA